MLIYKHQIPHTYTAGKSVRKISLNVILTMQWAARKKLHDSLFTMCRQIIRNSPKQVVNETDKLRVSFGFYSAKSTGNCDLDNFSYIQKVYIDTISSEIGINDSYRHIVEVRTIYLGVAEKEALIAQVEIIKNNENTPCI